jgi:hypothetical protein
MAGLLDQAPSFETIAKRAWHNPRFRCRCFWRPTMRTWRILSSHLTRPLLLRDTSTGPHAQSSDMIDFDQLQRVTTR